MNNTNPRSIFTAPGSFHPESAAFSSGKEPNGASAAARNKADHLSASKADDPSLWNPQPGFKRPALQGRSVPTAAVTSRRTTEALDILKAPSTAGKKRPADDHVFQAPRKVNSEPQRKKPRLLPRSKHTLDHLSFAGLGITGPPVGKFEPPSPLFFSNHIRPRPQLPPRFSSSEAGATMLSKAQGEDSHVKTVTLARGTFSGSSPPVNALSNAFMSRRSMDRASLPRTGSPESRGKNDSLDVLSSIGIIELLEQDERPTFIVDLGEVANYNIGPLHLVFANSSLRAYDGLLDLVTGKVEDDSSGTSSVTKHQRFKAWLLGASSRGESLDVCLPSFTHAEMSWSCSTLRKRLRIISGAYPSTSNVVSHLTSGGLSTASMAPIPLTREALDGSRISSSGTGNTEEPHDYFGNVALPSPETPARQNGTSEIIPTTETPEAKQTEQASIGFNGRLLNQRDADVVSLESYPSQLNDMGISTKEEVHFDWTRLPVSASMPRHIRFARSIDWSNTSLGPIETWSSDLRQMCNLIMASPHPAAMYWGPDLIAIYNEAYVLLAGQKHPDLMGQSYAVAWAEIWDEVKDVFANAVATGEATMKDDDCLFMKRNNYLEETYFSWSIIPMVGGDGSVRGLYNPAFEKTRRKIAERRMLTLREVGEKTAAARDIKGFWAEVLDAMEFNEYDTPFVLLYSVSDDSDSDSSSVHSNSLISTKQCYLEGALGVPEGHHCAPDTIDLRTGMEGFGPVFREVMKTDKPVLLELGAGDLPFHLLEGLEWRGFGDPCRAVVICPIHPTTGESVLGFLVLGVNPRRPYDEDYSLFVQLLSRQLATSLASVVLFEEEIRRGQKAAKLAALDRIELSEQLAARTQEAIDSETKFTRMAEFAPVGMFIADSDGHITYCNDTWYEISRVPKETDSTDRWMDAVKDEDKALVRNLWYDLVENTKPTSAEFRFKAPWEDRNGTRGDTWVLFSAYPEKHDNGTLKSVFGSITNISQQKWAEGFQKRKMEEAVELKRQQENFIDITSHEMRNPLSAILQCADEISGSMIAFRNSKAEKLPADLVSSSIDAAQTIALCAQHQKRIVDDVLTLSKLDSAMLLVTPVDAQPLTVVQRALKMFEGELQTADIQMKFIVDESFKKLNVDWVRIDPSRVLQVLINLTTNAIKFTTTESKRTITIIISASLEKPSLCSNRVVNFFPTRSKRIDMTQGPDWGEGEEIFLHFAVQDTGRGLSDEEKKLLFLRFSQASPRTHVQYGGSGLGLFISRELTELQGGEIGVASEAGRGSTFAFYVKARRSKPPQNAADNLMAGMCRPNSGVIKSKARASQATAPKTKDFAIDGGQSTKPKENKSGVKEPLKVLIVEDNLVNQRVLQKQLKNLGCIVHVANHGGEALERLRESQYWKGNGKDKLDLSVVLMDQEMPVMDGLTCTRKIRELQSEGKLVRHVPIIAVTANARSEQIQTAMAAGMDDVVSKPFRVPELIPKIEELMERYRQPSASPPPSSQRDD